MGFTKLDEGILQSSVMAADPVTFKVWIALLAACGCDGVARVAPTFLASVCRLEIAAVVKALEELSGIDPYSRSPQNEGRRIERCDGGWRITNHAKYRGWTYSQKPEAIRKRRQREHSDVTSRDIDVPVDGTRRDVSGPSASASPSASVRGEGTGEGANFYRPAAADRAERAVTEEIRRLQLILGGKLAELAEHPNSRDMVPAWTRRVTAYDRQDGSRQNGVADYRTLMSIPRLEKSIEDADYWLAKLEKGPLEAKRGA